MPMNGANLGTNGSAGTIAATTSPDTCKVILPASVGTFTVDNDSASAANLLVSVPGIHDPADFDVIRPGRTAYYGAPKTSFVLTFKTATGTATGYVSAVSYK